MQTTFMEEEEKATAPETATQQSEINLRITELRKKLRLSQPDFGSRIGMSRQQVSAVESGISNYTVVQLIAIKEQFGLTWEYIFEGKDGLSVENHVLKKFHTSLLQVEKPMENASQLTLLSQRNRDLEAHIASLKEMNAFLMRQLEK